MATTNTPTPFTQFAQSLVNDACYVDPKVDTLEKNCSDTRITIPRSEGEWSILDLTPFEARAQACTARPYFEKVRNYTELVQAYEKVRADFVFETQVPGASDHVSEYAGQFMQGIFSQAQSFMDEARVQLICRWIVDLDAYTAVKAIESLLNSKADLTLLQIAAQHQWQVLFDHLAIRCGSQANGDAERVVEMLKTHHGYVSPQLDHEAFYQFPDGWNAYPLYKILENGQVLRLFIDQSGADHPQQIIQHWNRVYGYTAHHLAIRATVTKDGTRHAVSLGDIVDALQAQGVASMTPTGRYTAGLLVQVFTQPEKNAGIPTALKQQIDTVAPGLGTTVENAKLLEIVSRREMVPEKAQRFFALYGITYDAHNPLHSAPVYQYFLPAQAAHVIKTSIQA
ncbi:MAG: hypothetical protein OEZ68_19385 [Gammaproteobacteria bacterium]|nr:hypothetical protein [Gammaproteobacteria bacterium]MDH5802973.1 hypothetical protein [Gammaproteobacteria bacterium]